MQIFWHKNAAKKFEYFKNNICDRFLDRKNKNHKWLKLLTRKTTKKYKKNHYANNGGHFKTVVVVVDPLLPDYWGESASVV